MSYLEHRKKIEDLCSASKEVYEVVPSTLAQIATEYAKMVKALSGDKAGTQVHPLHVVSTECGNHRHRLCVFMTSSGNINAFDFFIAQGSRKQWRVADVRPFRFTPRQFADAMDDEDQIKETIEQLHESLDFVICGALYSRRVATA